MPDAPSSPQGGSVSGILQKKIGGVPAYVYGGVVVLAVGIFWFMRKRGSAGSAGNTPSGSAAGTSQLPFIPVTQVTGISGPGAGSTGAGNEVGNTVTTGGLNASNQAWIAKFGKRVGLYNDPNRTSAETVGSWIPFGTKLKVIGQAVSGKGWGGEPVTFLPVDVYGKKMYVNAAAVDFDNQTSLNPQGGGIGGKSPFAEGFAQPYVPGQYAVIGGTPWGNQQAAGIGGAGGINPGGRLGLDPVAKAAAGLNVPPARIRALNRLQPFWNPSSNILRIG